jgi:PKD repeat protein
VPPLLKTIALTVTDTVGQTDSVSHDVMLQDDPPVAAFTWVATDLVVDFDASTSSDDHGIVSWDWSFGGSGVTATYTFPAAGTYPVTLTVTDTVGQTASQTQDVTVTEGGPAIVPSFTGVTASGGKLTVDASASTAQAGIYRYDWNFGDNIISWGVTHLHIYVATGTYTVTLTVTDMLGQKAETSQTFYVVNTALPPLPYTVHGYVTSGGAPVMGASVNVTNVRTQETMIDIVTADDGAGGALYYIDNIMPLYFLQTGDTAVFAAASGPLSGEVTLVLDLTGSPYLQVDILLT